MTSAEEESSLSADARSASGIVGAVSVADAGSVDNIVDHHD